MTQTDLRAGARQSSAMATRTLGRLLWRHLAAELAALAWPPPFPAFDAAPEDDFEVNGCHVTMARNPQALRIVATRLARRFDPDPATTRPPF